MRKLTSLASDSTQVLLQLLVDKQSSPEKYRHAMTELGRDLGAQMVSQVPSLVSSPICVACTAEDADFLARGVIEGLERAGADASRLRLICFWNARVRRFEGAAESSFDVAPIVKEYREPVDLKEATVVIVKSIISGACVVKTNLAALIEDTQPQTVLVAAPVMLEGAERRLASEFPRKVSRKFRYFTFAVDNEKAGDEIVVPGIGGSVYERLGFGDVLAVVPEIVSQRRPRFVRA